MSWHSDFGVLCRGLHLRHIAEQQKEVGVGEGAGGEVVEQQK